MIPDEVGYIDELLTKKKLQQIISIVYKVCGIARTANFLDDIKELGFNMAYEGGLSMGYEKFIMDADQAGMLAVMLQGVDMSENGQAMDAFREIGPGGHYLGANHTQANFETAFYRSEVADNNSFEQWEQEGGFDCAKRANLKWKSMLQAYEPPSLDPAIDEALIEFISKRKSEFEDRDY